MEEGGDVEEEEEEEDVSVVVVVEDEDEVRGLLMVVVVVVEMEEGLLGDGDVVGVGVDGKVDVDELRVGWRVVVVGEVMGEE